MASRVFLKASVPLSTKSLLSLVKLASSCRMAKAIAETLLQCLVNY